MVRRATQLLQEFSIPLILGIVVAIAWANIAPDAYRSMVSWTPFSGANHWDLRFLVNDIFMALFFGIAAKEITESCLPGGALNPPRKAINPLFATVGGVIGPIAVYTIWCALCGEPGLQRGWGIPTATDIALAWLVARMAFGKGHPAISFLLLLAVADDGIGLVIIAVFYPDPAHPFVASAGLLVVAAVVLAWAFRRWGVRSFWLYLLVPGVISWIGFHSAHLHPALALVPVVPFMPSLGHDEGLFVETEDAHGVPHHDTLNQFEHTFKLPVDVGLFAFGLANAGVTLSSVGNATWAVLGALIIGKTMGIFLAAMFAHCIGFRLPEGLQPRALFLVGLIAALGLTVALFVAGVAFTDPGLQGAAKMGALMSVVVVPVVFVVARLLRVRQTARPPKDEKSGLRGFEGVAG